jgi:hypothetical protein
MDLQLGEDPRNCQRGHDGVTMDREIRPAGACAP